jgi:hypothetical protein
MKSEQANRTNPIVPVSCLHWDIGHTASSQQGADLGEGMMF